MYLFSFSGSYLAVLKPNVSSDHWKKAAWLWYENLRNPSTENRLPLWYESKTSSRQSVYFWEDVLTSLSGSLDHVVSYPQRRMASWRERCSLFVARLMEGREVMFVLNLSSVGQLCTLRQCMLESFYTHTFIDTSCLVESCWTLINSVSKTKLREEWGKALE